MMTTTNPTAGAAAMREAMVSSQLRTTGVDDLRVIGAMATVAREDFVPAAAGALAYRDATVSLGRGRFLNTPLATARLINEAGILAEDRVLLIGAATGYAAALVARLGARVTAVEEDGELLATARVALAATDLGGGTVELIEGSLAAGQAAGAPYDVLLIDGAVEELPDALVAQLRVDGRIATGLVDRGVTRLATGRRTEGGAGTMAFTDAECVVLPGFARAPAFRF